MSPTKDKARRRSADMFNNDKLVEVVLMLDRAHVPITAQEIARPLGVTHDLVKKVLVRLESLALVKAQPRIGGSRGALPYEVQQSDEWSALARLCELLAP